MRSRFAVPASLVVAAAAAGAAVPMTAAAAPHHNHHLSIAATPNPILAGDPVMIYGQLNEPNHAHKLIVLLHRVNPAKRFTVVQATYTDAEGFYDFPRADGVVESNRSWYVVSPGAGNIHSRTVSERVAATLTLTSSSATGDTNHPLIFAGRITPTKGSVGAPIRLQVLQGGTGQDWHTIAIGHVAGDGSYTIRHRFLQPGDRDVRVLFAGDARNISAASDPVSVSIQQRQVRSFTINTSQQTIDEGQSATISGVLSSTGTTTTPLGAQNVTLFGRTYNGRYAAIASTMTGVDGSYSFSVTPVHNSVYQVRSKASAVAKARRSAQLFEGVRDVVTISASSSSSTVGGTVTFSGSVSPGKAGHVIYLERLGSDGEYHVVATGRVGSSSMYRFTRTFGTTGTPEFRVRIPGGDSNVGGVSAPVRITIASVPVQTLPAAS